MINSTKQLNEIIRNLTNENATASISQLAAIISLCSKAGIRFSVDVNYDEAFSLFTANQFPEWNTDYTNNELESLAKQGKYAEATIKREEFLLIKKEIQRRLRLEKYGTENWFIEKSESEILFLPTDIEIIDSLISRYIL